MQKATIYTLFAIHNSFEFRIQIGHDAIHIPIQFIRCKSYSGIIQSSFEPKIQIEHDAIRKFDTILIKFILHAIQKSYELQTAFNLKLFPRFILFSNLGWVPSWRTLLDCVRLSVSLKVFLPRVGGAGRSNYSSVRSGGSGRGL